MSSHLEPEVIWDIPQHASYPPRKREPQVEDFSPIGDRSDLAVTMHTGETRVVVREKGSVVATADAKLRPAAPSDIEKVRRAARKGSRARRLVDAYAPQQNQPR